MTGPLSTVRVRRRYGVPPQRVFEAWLDRRAAGRWLFATASRPMTRVAIDPRVDGSFRFVERRDGRAIAYAGEYLEIVPPRRLVFTLSVDGESPAPTRVVIQVVPLQTGSEVRLTHERVPVHQAGHTQGRWSGILYGLGVTLGDVEITRRRPTNRGA